MNAVYCGMNSCLKNYLSILPDWQGKSKIISKKHECNASSYCSNETRYQFCSKHSDCFFRNAVDGLKSWLFCQDYRREEKRSATVPFDLLERCKYNALIRLCCIGKRGMSHSSGKICRNRFESYSWKILFLSGAVAMSLKFVKGKTIFARTLVRQKIFPLKL